MHLPVLRDHFYRHTLRTQLRGKEFPTKPMQGLVEPVLDSSAGSPQKKFPTCSLFPGGKNPELPDCSHSRTGNSSFLMLVHLLP